jgi:cyclopropane fatty-acyl-phospholipid synthase-like methyltransferase
MIDQMDNKKLYDDFYSKDIWDKRSSLSTRLVNYLVKDLVKGIDLSDVNAVLDVGAGDGSKTFNLLNIFPTATVEGVDYSSEGVIRANNLYSSQSDRINFFEGDVNINNYINKKYDMVTSFYFLEHIENWQNVVEYWVSSNIKYLMIFVPIGKMYKMESKEHFRHFGKKEMEDFLTARSYKCLKKFYYGFPFYHPITKIAMDLVQNSVKDFIAKEPSFFAKLMYNVLYILYTKFTSKRVGGDFIGLFEKI